MTNYELSFTGGGANSLLSQVDSTVDYIISRELKEDSNGTPYCTTKWNSGYMTFEKQYPDKTFSFPTAYNNVFYNTYDNYLTLPAFKKIYSINMSPTKGYGGIWFVPANISNNKLTFRAFNGTNTDSTTAYCIYVTGTWK